MQKNKNIFQFGSSLMINKEGLLPEEVIIKKCIHCEKKNHFATTDLTAKCCPFCGSHLILTKEVSSEKIHESGSFSGVDKICTHNTCNRLFVSIPKPHRFCTKCGHHLKELAGQKNKKAVHEKTRGHSFKR